MFDFLFKSKKKPKPIFKSLRTDMHCHLIPMVDDGSKSLEESISCLRTMEQVGYKKVFVTPHFQYPRFPNMEEDIKRRFEELKRCAAEAGLGIELVGVGCEYRLDPEFMERIKDRALLTVGDDGTMDRGYLLVELSLQHKFPGMMDIISQLQQQDYVVVLAHPERYPYLNVNGSEIEAIRNMGVLLQVNVLSLDGFYGDVVRRKAEAMIQRGWVELLGTDTHNVLYAEALVHASNNKRIERILANNNFLNIDL